MKDSPKIDEFCGFSAVHEDLAKVKAQLVEWQTCAEKLSKSLIEFRYYVQSGEMDSSKVYMTSREIDLDSSIDDALEIFERLKKER